MFGLGVYFASDSSKSDQYISDKNHNKIYKKGRKMLCCTVEVGVCEVVTVMKSPQEYHDKVLPKENCDSIYAPGQGKNNENGKYVSVINDEYVIFHPHQALPEYMIEYDLP